MTRPSRHPVRKESAGTRATRGTRRRRTSELRTIAQIAGRSARHLAAVGLLGVVVAATPAAAPAAHSAFGRDIPGSAWYPMGADYKRSSRFALPAAATVTHLAAHLDGLGGASGSQQLRYALYADEDGRPRDLLAQSAIGTVTAGRPADWLRLPLPDPLPLEPGAYHLAILSGPSGGVARYSRAPAPAGLLSGPDAFADGASTPYGTGTPDDFEIAIHARFDGDASEESPDPPTGLVQTDSTATSVDVAWNASGDRVPVIGYSVYADGVPEGTTSSTEYGVEKLACGRTYTIEVEALTAAGNVSSRATVAAATAACPPDAVTCDRVAATSGSDSNAGTLSSPYRTAQKLADTLASGQTGCLRGGSYTSGGSIYVLNATRGGYRLRSYPGERARLVGIVMIRSAAAGLTLSHLDIEGTGTSNTIKVHAADVVVEHNTITNEMRAYSCMLLGDNVGTGAAVRTIVRRNRFHDCGSLANGNKDHGIYTAKLVDGRIVGNVFWNTAAYAIHLYPNAQRTLVTHNVVDGDSPSVRGGIIVAGDAAYASSDNVIEQNVVAYARTANIETYWESAVGTGNVARRNCVWAGREGDIRGTGLTATDNLTADPLFVERAGRDYRLSTSSSCLPLLDYDPASLLD